MDWLILLFCAVGFAKAENYTFTYNMAQQCKEHICRHGYKYETFYRIDSEDHRHIKSDSNLTLEMHIAILGANNGHILLSPTPSPGATTAVYEIDSMCWFLMFVVVSKSSSKNATITLNVSLPAIPTRRSLMIGGGGNKFTELRRNLRRNAKDSANTLNVLSAVEFRAFYIKISKDGLVEFGREGESPLLRYFDVSPIDVEYFSFASWHGVEAKFLYDCPANGANSSKTNSKAVDRPRSNSDQLKATLVQDRPPHLPPRKSVDVKFGLKITSVKYNPFDSKLAVGVAVVISWVDSSMAWNPEKFNNITRLTFEDGIIWRPTFFLINADDKGSVDMNNPGPTTMVNSGEATFYFQSELTTWCYEYAKTLNRWPHDEYKCSVVLGTWEAHEKITMDQLGDKDVKMAVFADTANIIPNEWAISYKQGVVTPEKWQTIFSSNDNETYQSDRFLINITLKRQAAAYNIVIYTPLIVLVLFVFMSFWGEPLQMSRVWFYAGSSVVINMGLCYVDYLMPVHTVPTVLILYVVVLFEILIALLIQVLLMTSVAKRLCETTSVYTLVTSRVFRIIFLLPAVKNGVNYDMINEAYAQEDDDTGVMISPRNGNIEEMETDKTVYGGREEVATAIDRLLFVIYSVVFAVMLAKHF